jgi:ferritin-like metal-binding protein YciE
MTKGEVQNPKTDDRIKDVEGYKSRTGTELFTLEDLFKHLLQDMYYAENKIAKTLPEMAEKATSDDLAGGFKTHLEETRDQIEKLKKVFEILGYQTEKEKCEAIEGLLEEGEGLIEEAAEGSTRDAALIAAAQKVEHYEIASYGTLCALAGQLGFAEAGRILHEILKQEKDTDQTLSDLSRTINEKSAQKAA